MSRCLIRFPAAWAAFVGCALGWSGAAVLAATPTAAPGKVPALAPAATPAARPSTDPVTRYLEDIAAPTAAAWRAKDFGAVRAAFARVLALGDAAAPYQRSYAQLRIAQSFGAEKNDAAAREAYARLAATADYPAVHRAEAEECVREIDRRRAGLPARDVLASRTPVAEIDTFAAEFFVGPRGDDANPGTAERPFATLERARDAVRAWRAARGAGPAPGPVAVRLLPGEYGRTGTFELGPLDSGTPAAPVVYRADRPGTAVLYGGTRLRGLRQVDDPAILARLPESARGRVWSCDLAAQGVTDLPPLRERGYGVAAPATTAEFFCDGQALTLARWPDHGFVNGGAILAAGVKATGEPSVFTYGDDRHARWTTAPDAWLYGYFAHGWADRTLAVRKIDPATKQVVCDPYGYGKAGMQPVKWFNQGRIKYQVFNLLEELDQPGEYYVDRRAGRLYFYPWGAPASAELEVGRLAVPMVVARGVTAVRFEGLVFDLGRANGLDWRDCTHCLIAGCTVRRFAGEAIGVRGGRECGLFGCDVYSLARGATTVTGGDRRTLEPARHFVENCHFFAFGRIDHTYVPAVQLEGVGHRVAHNFFHDCPSSVVRIEGNDHVLEYNEVRRAVQESEDQGAMEMFGNPTYRGVIFRHNVFADIGGAYGGGAAGRAGIRLDDVISGITIYGNLFVRAAQSFGGINLNGGRDNVIDNNLFVECEKGITGGYNPRNAHWAVYAAAPADSPQFPKSERYLARYPELRYVELEPGENFAWRDGFWRCGPALPPSGQAARARFRCVGLVELPADQDPGFVDAAGGDYRLRADETLLAGSGLRPIPVREIGPYAHPLRASWPLQRGR